MGLLMLQDSCLVLPHRSEEFRIEGIDRLPLRYLEVAVEFQPKASYTATNLIAHGIVGNVENWGMRANRARYAGGLRSAPPKRAENFGSGAAIDRVVLNRLYKLDTTSYVWLCRYRRLYEAGRCSQNAGQQEIGCKFQLK